MSVNSCGRKDCESIMCDRTILNGAFYICESCFSELDNNRRFWPDYMKISEVRENIERFMKTKPGATITPVSAKIEAEFKKLTEY
jgi:hypothetical protein